MKLPNVILSPDISKSISGFFSQIIREHGNTPYGVGWNGLEAQIIRFKELCRIIDGENHFSLLDFGCGYGALLQFLKESYLDFIYKGYDITEEMIAHATNHFAVERTVKWETRLSLVENYDYVVASGIFNKKFEFSDTEWEPHIFDTLHSIDARCRKGFSFNMLTSYSGKEFMRNDLYYGDPLFFFDYCMKNFSRKVALLHDYQLYDFTILVRK